MKMISLVSLVHCRSKHSEDKMNDEDKNIHELVREGKADPSLGIKVGDIVTGYHKGYHKVTEVMPRKDSNGFMTALITYSKILDGNGKPCSARVNACDAAWCGKPLTIDRLQELKRDELKKVEDKFDALLKVVTQPIKTGGCPGGS